MPKQQPPAINYYQERHFGQILNATFGFLRGHLRALLKWAFLAAFPFGMGLFAWLHLNNPEQQIGLKAFFYCHLINIPFLALVVYVYLSHYEQNGQAPGFKAFFRRYLSGIPRVVGTSLVLMLLAGLGFLVVLLPGFYVLIALGPALFVSLRERGGPFAEIGRSFRLVNLSFWKAAGLFGVLMLLQLSFWFMAGMLHQIFSMGLSAFMDVETAILPHSIDYPLTRILLDLLLLFLITLIMVVPITTQAFLYYSQVELAESPTLQWRIEERFPLQEEEA